MKLFSKLAFFFKSAFAGKKKMVQNTEEEYDAWLGI